MNGLDDDVTIRDRAFHWLSEQIAIHDDVLPRPILEDGFVFEGKRIRLVGPQGIFKPQCMSLPISITTVVSGPYQDEFDAAGLLLYRYRGTDPNHRDNKGLRRIMELGAPLIYFHGIAKSKYVAAWPVFIVADNPLQLTFSVAVDDTEVLKERLVSHIKEESLPTAEDRVRQAYITRNFRQRLHQSSFRERVLRAYREQCALCRLRHRELLDAAHIIPDTEPGGEPIVPNGLALCKLHHAAFDRYFVGIREDGVVEVRRDVLEERDGPMLIHGLQNLHNSKIIIPRAPDLRPDPKLLSRRYQRFKAAS